MSPAVQARVEARRAIEQLALNTAMPPALRVEMEMRRVLIERLRPVTRRPIEDMQRQLDRLAGLPRFTRY
jgi:hypothetical protein